VFTAGYELGILNKAVIASSLEGTHLERDVKFCFVLTYICPCPRSFTCLAVDCRCVCVCSSELTNRALRIYDVMGYLFVTQCNVGPYLRSVLAGVMQLFSCSILWRLCNRPCVWRMINDVL
jgi:hypothetical protein